MQLDYIATAKSYKCLSRLFFMTLEILHFLISGTVLQSRIKIVIQWISVSKAKCTIQMIVIYLAPVVQKLDSANQRINHYPVDKW